MNQIFLLMAGAGLTVVSSIFTGLVFFILRQISHKIDGLDEKIDAINRTVAGEQVRVENLTASSELAHQRISELRREIEDLKRLVSGLEKQFEIFKERFK